MFLCTGPFTSAQKDLVLILERRRATGTGVQTRDRAASADPRFAGINANSVHAIPNGDQCIFPIDLPAAGTGTISLASGDASNLS
jgi:hypothetical protein